MADETSPSLPVDRVLLRGFRVMAYCGVLDEEQARRQPFELDIDIAGDLAAAGKSDDLADTINYGAVGDDIENLLGNGRFFLLERLAQEVADLILGYDGAVAVTVEVRKLRPPMAQDLAASGVRIHRVAS